MLVLPKSVKPGFARRFLGWDIDPTARIGRSLILVGHVSMGPGAIIGSFNVIRGLEEVRLGKGATIATRNFISAHPLAALVFPHSPNRRSCLVMGEFAKITVHHEIDCSDRVEFEPYAALVGFGSQILTHSADLVRDRQIANPVVLGERSAVMSGCILLSGTAVPARAIVSAGSTITTKLTKEQVFYRGNPAVEVRELPDRLGYYHRVEQVPEPSARRRRFGRSSG